MSFPQQSAGRGQGFFDNSSGSHLPVQDDWTTDIPDKNLAFELGYGLLNSTDDFGRQNQNIDLALHAIGNSSQFMTPLPSSQYAVGSPLQWPLNQPAQPFNIGHTEITGWQTTQPDTFISAGQIFCPPSLFQLPNGHQGSLASAQSVQINKSMGLVPKCSTASFNHLACNGNSEEWESSKSGMHNGSQVGILTNTRSGGYNPATGNCFDEDSTNHASRMQMQDVVVESISRSNAIDTIKNWRMKYPKVFPRAEHVKALAALCKLQPLVIEELLIQILQEQPEGTSNAIGSVQPEEPLAKRSKTDSGLLLASELAGSPFDPTNLEDAALWVREHVLKCRPVANHSQKDAAKIYQCTSNCGMSFLRKGDWRRHEEQRYPQEGWICYLGVTALVKGILTCVYCNTPNPEPSHAIKNHPEHFPGGNCRERPLEAPGRIFKRKDRFIEHFKKTHPSIPSKEYLRQSHFVVNSRFPSRCGFCRDYLFRDWRDRIQHLGHHFESRKDMSSWISNFGDMALREDRNESESLSERKTVYKGGMLMVDSLSTDLSGMYAQSSGRHNTTRSSQLPPHDLSVAGNDVAEPIHDGDSGGRNRSRNVDIEDSCAVPGSNPYSNQPSIPWTRGGSPQTGYDSAVCTSVNSSDSAGEESGYSSADDFVKETTMHPSAKQSTMLRQLPGAVQRFGEVWNGSLQCPTVEHGCINDSHDMFRSSETAIGNTSVAEPALTSARLKKNANEVTSAKIETYQSGLRKRKRFIGRDAASFIPLLDTNQKGREGGLKRQCLGHLGRPSFTNHTPQSISKKCTFHIKNAVSQLGEEIELYSITSSRISMRVLEAISNVRRTDPLLLKGMKLYAMHYFATHSIRFTNSSSENLARRFPVSTVVTEAYFPTIQILSRRIKHAILVLTDELTVDLLQGLDTLMKVGTAASWLLSVGVILVLCLYIEEIQEGVSTVTGAFPPSSYSERDRVKFLKMGRDLEVLFHQITTRFHSSYITKKCLYYRSFHPLRDGLALDAGLEWNKQQADLIRDIRGILTDFEDEIIQRQGSDEPDFTVPHETFHHYNRGRLVAKFLGSFVSKEDFVQLRE